MIVVQLKKSTPQTAINNNCKPFWMSSRKYNFSFFFPFSMQKVMLCQVHMFKEDA